MNMKDQKRPDDLKARTKAFALRIIRLYVSLPKSGEAQVLGRQLIKSGTSVGTHYHESLRACSDAEVISKLEGAQAMNRLRFILHPSAFILLESP